MIGERWTVRDWIYLESAHTGDTARLLFAPVPESQGMAKAAPFVVLNVALAVSGRHWDVSSAEYFDALAIALHALQGGAQ
jgi:hypothetical protein